MKIFLPLHSELCYFRNLSVPDGFVRLKSLLTVKKFITVVLLVLSVIAASCCSRRVENGYRTIAYVNSLLADSLSGLRILAECNGKSSGAIVLVGDPAGCLRLSERMLLCDEFDNIDAKRSSDGLPDFAGETIVSVLNFVDTAYQSLAATKDGQVALRELTIRNSLASLRIRQRCKILIICSPVLSEYGGGDVRDLFERVGCNVPVIYSSDTTVSLSDVCFLTMRKMNMFTHNISYPSASLFMTIRDSIDSKESVVPFVDSLVPASFPDTVGVLAPNTYYSYVVQNQH